MRRTAVLGIASDILLALVAFALALWCAFLAGRDGPVLLLLYALGIGILGLLLLRRGRRAWYMARRGGI